jgi:hypothetical protein
MAKSNHPPEESRSVAFDPAVLSKAPFGRKRLAIHKALRLVRGENGQKKYKRALRFGLLESHPEKHVAVIEVPDTSVVSRTGFVLRLLGDFPGAGRKVAPGSRAPTHILTRMRVRDALHCALKSEYNLKLIWKEESSEA